MYGIDFNRIFKKPQRQCDNSVGDFDEAIPKGEIQIYNFSFEIVMNNAGWLKNVAINRQFNYDYI